MGTKLLVRLGVTAGAAVVAALTTTAPARAGSTIAVNPGNVPTTAAAYGSQDCDENFGGGPLDGRDVWVFVLPGNQDKAGDFVSVTATFGAHGSLTVPADGGAVVTDKGASKAWITTPAGWTLTGASAVITGTAARFNLTHTCPAAGSTQPSTPATTTPSTSPAPSAPVSTSPGTPTAPAPTGSQGGGTDGGATGGGSGTAGGSGGLPVTGTAVTGIAVTGAALVAGGIALLSVRRRRTAVVFTAETGTDRP